MCSQAARCVLLRIVSAGVRFNPRSLRIVSSVDAEIDPRTQATITATSSYNLSDKETTTLGVLAERVAGAGAEIVRYPSFSLTHPLTYPDSFSLLLFLSVSLGTHTLNLSCFFICMLLSSTRPLFRTRRQARRRQYAKYHPR
jgi:hypothetical protein